MQRGAAAVAAAVALRRGDAAGLTELGLDLAELTPLGPFAQCDRILQAVLGNDTHPDEHALRRAAAIAVKAIITSPGEVEPMDVIRDFISGYVMDQGLVELRAQREAGADVRVVVEKERRIRNWIKASVRAVATPATGRLTITEIIRNAGTLAQSALRILVAGAPAT